jgi:hypothetical protein
MLAGLLILGCETASEAADAGASAAPEDVAVDTGPQKLPLTYNGAIQPILAEWCGDCHSGDNQECPGDTCFVDHYEDLLLPSDTCGDFNKAKCGLKRIKATADPNDDFKLIGKNGPIILPQAQIDMLDEWIWDLGMPEG